MVNKNTLIFFLTASLLVVGQALWKIASIKLMNKQYTTVFAKFIYLLTNIPFLSGVIFYIIATVMWIYLLGRFEYSKIYPVFVGTCVILSIVVGYLFFNEIFNIRYKLVGASFIILGIYFIVK